MWRPEGPLNDYLIQLQSVIRKAFVNTEHLISIFIDLENAYDLAWKHGIMLDLHRLGLRGRMPLFIQEFLKNRKFQVKLKNSISHEYIQENGIPQGNVLSVTRFIIKMNELTNVIRKSARSKVCLYMDDLQVSYWHSDL